MRKSRTLRLSDLAREIGRSIGWLSQVERGLSRPTIDDLRSIAAVLDVDVSTLFQAGPGRAGEEGVVFRRDQHRPVAGRLEGMVEQVLSPDLDAHVEVTHATVLPGAHLAQPVQRDVQELGFVVSGQFEIWISGRRFALGPGDTFRIRGEPVCWMNTHPDPCEIVWITVAPRG